MSRTSLSGIVKRLATIANRLSMSGINRENNLVAESRRTASLSLRTGGGGGGGGGRKRKYKKRR